MSDFYCPLIQENELMHGFKPVGAILQADGAKIHFQDARLMCSGH